MKRLLLSLCVLALPVLGGCASVDMRPSSGAAEHQIFGDLQRQEFSKQLQVQLPAKLAVADVTQYDRGARNRRLVATVRELETDAASYTDVVTLEGETWTREQLRDRAAGHQADLLLVVQRDEVVREDTNGLAFLKILLIPQLFIPTESNDVELTMRAMVMDVRNGLVYTTFDSNAQAHYSSAAATEWSRAEDELDRMAADMMPKLRETLTRKLIALEKQSGPRR